MPFASYHSLSNFKPFFKSLGQKLQLKMQEWAADGRQTFWLFVYWLNIIDHMDLRLFKHVLDPPDSSNVYAVLVPS